MSDGFPADPPTACLPALGALPFIANGTASPAERQECAAHLAVCGACRAELAQALALRDALVALPRGDPAAAWRKLEGRLGASATGHDAATLLGALLPVLDAAGLRPITGFVAQALGAPAEGSRVHLSLPLVRALAVNT
jgi:hypothetical protein